MDEVKCEYETRLPVLHTGISWVNITKRKLEIEPKILNGQDQKKKIMIPEFVTVELKIKGQVNKR